MAKRHSGKKKNPVANKVGLPPGSIVYVGKKRDDEVSLELISFDNKTYTKHIYSNCRTLFAGVNKSKVNWINVDGIHNQQLINEFQDVLGLDHLLLEDVVNTYQRPKLEEYDSLLFLPLKMLRYNDNTKSIDSEQVSFVLTDSYVISFQEKVGDVFGTIRDRIENSKGQIRLKATDYLFYSLIDSVIDNYFLVIENIGNDLEDLEDEIFNNPSEETLEKIHAIKNELLILRRSIYPLRESINKLSREDVGFIHETTKKYFGDVYDHTIQLIDIIESYKEIITSLKDSYLSNLSLKMNQVMQVLTIIATIFIPLTFIAGVYGMNFRNIPELEWQNGYFFFWMLTLVIVILLVFYFKNKKWL